MGMVEARRGAAFLFAETDPVDAVTPEDMGEESRMMMRAIRDFAEREVKPVMDEVENRNGEVIRDLFRKAADLGIFMAEVPEEHGGLGLNVMAIAAMMESRSYLGGLSSTVFAHQGIGTLPLVNFGTDAQIEKYLAPCMSGDMMAAFALTEPSSGSDAMNIKTSAVLSEDGSHYVVNGAKQFITNAGWADLFILFAKVNGEAFTAFLLERDSEGVTVGPNERLLGLHSSSVSPITLENVRIPAENVLGEVGKGHKVALCTLNLGRMKMAANCVGMGKKALQCAAQYASERVQFGQPIAEFGLIQEKLAEMAVRLYTAESMAYRTAGLVYSAVESMDDSQKRSLTARLSALTEFAAECAMAKVYCSEMVNAAADEALQIHGGYGFSEEYPPAKMYRDSRITRIYEGTSEINRLGIMKAVLKRIASPDFDWSGKVAAARKGDGAGTPASGPLAKVRRLKNVFLITLDEARIVVGPEALLDKNKQAILGHLADMAIEIFGAESAALRKAKLQLEQGEAASAPRDALVELSLERAADKVRHAATEILTALHSGEEFARAWSEAAACLPNPLDRMSRRETVARAVLDNDGRLPF